MTQITVKELATKVGMPTDRLIAQLNRVGITVTEDQAINEEALLNKLKGGQSGKLSLKKPQVKEELKQASRKSVTVKVKRKITLQRSTEEEPVEKQAEERTAPKAENIADAAASEFTTTSTKEQPIAEVTEDSIIETTRIPVAPIDHSSPREFISQKEARTTNNVV